MNFSEIALRTKIKNKPVDSDATDVTIKLKAVRKFDKAEAKLITVVVLPTPPFPEQINIVRVFPPRNLRIFQMIRLPLRKLNIFLLFIKIYNL